MREKKSKVNVDLTERARDIYYNLIKKEGQIKYQVSAALILYSKLPDNERALLEKHARIEEGALAQDEHALHVNVQDVAKDEIDKQNHNPVKSEKVS